MRAQEKWKGLKDPPSSLAYGKLFCVITLMISTCSSETNIEISVMTFDYIKDNEALTLPLSESIIILNTVFTIIIDIVEFAIFSWIFANLILIRAVCDILRTLYHFYIAAF